MSIRSRVAIAAIAMFAVAPALMAQSEKVKETKPGLFKKAKVTADAAIATAQGLLPNAKLDAGEIEEEGGKLIYSFDFKTDGKTGIDEVNINAMTGKLVGKINHESPAAEAKEEKADKKAAMKKAPKKP